MTATNPFMDQAAHWPRLKARRGVIFWVGCAMTALGCAAVLAPEVGHLVVGGMAGWLLWFAGSIMLAGSLLLIGSRPFVGGVVSGLVAIGAGAYLLYNPKAGALAVTILAAAAFVVDGAFQLALALNLRPLKVWRWILASALASGLAALVIAFGFPMDSPRLFGLVVGAAVLSTGLAFIALSDAMKKA